MTFWIVVFMCVIYIELLFAEIIYHLRICQLYSKYHT